jgi:transposase-like protein
LEIRFCAPRSSGTWSPFRHRSRYSPNINPIFRRRIIQLYFVAGWTVRDISKRYNMTAEMARKSLTEWRIRAISSGYIQEIGPEILPLLASSSDPAEDPDDEAPERPAGTHPPRAPLQVVPPLAPSPVPQPAGILHVFLEELEAPEEPYCRRLLRLLKQECIQSGLTLSTVQSERIEAVNGSPTRTGPRPPP